MRLEQSTGPGAGHRDQLSPARLDLNLIVALDALLTEGSVAGAAARLRLSEPAMSRTLGRIRRALGDPVLVRSGRGLVPTPRALALHAEAHDLVTRAQALFVPPEEPDPALLRRTFTILSADSALSMGAELLARLRAEAPGVALRFVGDAAAGDEFARLRDGSIDLDIGSAAATPPPEIRVEPLVRDRMAPAVRAGHPLTKGPVTLERLAAAEHISASRRGRATGPLDALLAEHGLARSVTVVVPDHPTALTMIAHTDLVGLLAATLNRKVADSLGLVLLDVAGGLPLPELEYSMSWHARFDADGAHRWLRRHVRDLAAELAGRA